MRTDLLKYVAKVLVKYGGNAVSAGIGGNVVVEIWDAWEKAQKSEKERKAELEALAQQSPAKLNEAVAQVVAEVAAGQPKEVQQAVAGYLQQIPGQIRRSLKRPADAKGLSVPAQMRLARAQDLAGLLPTQMPRFAPGQRPLAGVDLELEELLGVGGFGEVWKARNPHLANARSVALKFCLDPTAANLLTHEAAMLDRVMKLHKEPGIIRLQHTYLSATPPCLEYEYVAGGDLAGLMAEWQEAGSSVSVDKATRIVARLARIVAAAHAQRVVHRDLKPANVLVHPLRDGKLVLKVADFGIGGMAADQAIAATRKGSVEETQVTALRGAYTPLYASPQQTRGDAPDPRDDVYSLGVIWYQMLVGDMMVGAPTGSAWRKRLADHGMTAPVLEVMESCFEQEPAARPAHASVLADKLEALLGPAASAEHPAAPAEEPAPRHWGLLVALLLLLALGGAGGVAYQQGWLPASEARKKAGMDADSATSKQVAALAKVETPAKVEPPPPKAETPPKITPPVKVETPAKVAPPPKVEPSPKIVTPAPVRAPTCKLHIEGDDGSLPVTLKQNDKVVVKRTANRDVVLKPGTYEIEAAGGKQGTRLNQNQVTVGPDDREIKLSLWQAWAAWAAEALHAGKIKAPPLKGEPEFAVDFKDVAKAMAVFPEGDTKKGVTFTYLAGRYRVGLDGYQSAFKGWAGHAYSKFAYQVTGRVTGSLANEWGMQILHDTKMIGHGITLTLNGNSEVLVKPVVRQKGPSAFPGFQVGPLRHAAIQQGSASNTLLAIVRGQELELYVNGVAVCDSITLPEEFEPCSLRLFARANGAAGAVEIENMRIWHAGTVPAPETRGALLVR